MMIAQREIPHNTVVGDEDGENASTLVGEDAARENLKMCWSVFCLTRIIQGFSLAPRPPFDSFHESIWPHHPERTTNVKRQVYGFHHNGELQGLTPVGDENWIGDT